MGLFNLLFGKTEKKYIIPSEYDVDYTNEEQVDDIVDVISKTKEEMLEEDIINKLSEIELDSVIYDNDNDNTYE